MLQVQLIGNVGADAVRKSGDGYEFISFRVCHNERFTGQDGVAHESTMWVDCILDKDAKVAEYLKAGTMVYVTGSLKLRIYSSEKDRCMKAGATIRVSRCELLSAKADPVPRRLVDSDGAFHDVVKYYHTDAAGTFMTSERGQKFAIDDNGWVVPIENAPQDIQIKAMQEQAAREQSQQQAPQDVQNRAMQEQAAEEERAKQATTQPPASSAPVDKPSSAKKKAK